MIFRTPLLNPLWLSQRCTLGCGPAAPAVLAWASLAMSAAGTAATVVAQKQSADAQEDYQKALGAANVENARVQSEQLRDQQAQTNESSARETQQATVASRKALSTATVAAGEAGVTGNSVDALLGDFKMQEGIYKESVLRQKQLTDVSAGQQLDGIRRGADANALNFNSPIAQTNYLAAALSVGAQAASVYSDVKYPRSNSAKVGRKVG